MIDCLTFLPYVTKDGLVELYLSDFEDSGIETTGRLIVVAQNTSLAISQLSALSPFLAPVELLDPMHLQEQSPFTREILASPNEDTWNDF